MESVEDQTNRPSRCPRQRSPQCRHGASTKRAKATGTVFLFVNSDKGETPDESRQSLRSHVMQQARSRRKWSTSKAAGNAAGAPPSSTQRRAPSSRLKIEPPDPLIASKPTSESAGGPEWPTPLTTPSGTPSTPASGLVSRISNTPSLSANSTPLSCQPLPTPNEQDYFGKDWHFLNPYANLPVKLDAMSRGMLDQYLVSLDQCFTLGGRAQPAISQSWFVAAFASRAFMHSLLCAAATHLYALGRMPYHKILQYESCTVSEIASTLNDPILGVTDGNIGAVFNLMCVDEACLTALDARTSNQESTATSGLRKRVHSDGLKQMIRVRGGLLKLRHNQCLFSFLLWHTTAHSVASFLPSPFFSCPDQLAPVLEQLSRTPCKADTPKRLARLLLAAGSHHRLVMAARHTISLSRQFEAWLKEDPKAPSFTDMGDFSGLIVQSLLLFLHSQISFDPMNEAIATAMVMFVVRKSNDATSLLDPLHFAATRWLQQGLRCAPDADWDPDVRLWVTTVGAICAQGSEEELEIENAFVWACQAWDVRTLEQLLDALQGVLWIASRFDSDAEHLWARLGKRVLDR